MKGFTNVQYGTREVGTPAPPKHVWGNSLLCGGVYLLTTCLAQELNWRLLPKDILQHV